MQDVLIKIKRAILDKRYAVSAKAEIEMERDRITRRDIEEAIMNAPAIHKIIRSRSAFRAGTRETLYVIIGISFEGLPIYTKGKWVKHQNFELFYFLISSKRAE